MIAQKEKNHFYRQQAAGSVQWNGQNQSHSSELMHKQVFPPVLNPVFSCFLNLLKSSFLSVLWDHSGFWDVIGPLCSKTQQNCLLPPLPELCLLFLFLNPQMEPWKWANDITVCFPGNKYYVIPACPLAGSGRNRNWWVLKEEEHGKFCDQKSWFNMREG